MLVSRTLTFRNIICSATLVSIVSIRLSNGKAVTEISQWTGLKATSDRRVMGGRLLVDLNHMNYRQCVRLCWLALTCTAVTFESTSQRCQLYEVKKTHRGGAGYKTAPARGSVALDISRAVMDSRKLALYGCDKRPCRETEMCAPVRSRVSYVCISLVHVFCEEAPPTVPNTEISMDGVVSAVYTCALGYHQTGSVNVSKCNRHTHRWSHVDVTCTKVTCSDPPTVAGALAEGASTSAGSVVTYTCLKGAAPTSQQMATICQSSTGQWSPIPRPCSVVSCGQPPSVDTLDMQMTDRSLSGAYPGLTAEGLKVAYGGEAVYTCSDGYISPPGSNYISLCQSSGIWSSTAKFACSPIDCGQPPSVDNASTPVYTTTGYGANATVKCLPGMLPLEGFTLTCGTTGSWGPEEMKCKPVDCGLPEEPKEANAIYNSTQINAQVDFQCKNSTVQVGGGNSTSICQEDGEWSPVTLTCSHSPCGPAPRVDNSSLEYLWDGGSLVAAYTCDHGFYTTDDLNTRVCVDVWSDNTVACAAVSCGQAPAILNADLASTKNYSYPSVASYTCQPGYILNSTASSKTCTATGRWSEEDVTCDYAGSSSSCLSDALPDNLAIDWDTVRETDYRDGVVVRLKCVNNTLMVPKTYQVGGPQLATVTAQCKNGTWGLTNGEEILCIPKVCAPPVDLPHARWELEKVGALVKAEYTCEDGYSFDDLAAVQDKSTPRPIQPTSRSEASCGAETGWERSPSRNDGCTPVQCGFIILSPESGLQAPWIYNMTYQSKVELSCRPPMYQNTTDLESQSLVECQAGGQWSMDDVTLTCAPCNQSEEAAGIPNSILHLGVSQGAGGVGGVANLPCRDGFALIANPGELTCSSVDGSLSWSDPGNATCVQTYWQSPVKAGTGYIAPVYTELVNRGMSACARLKLVQAGRAKLTLIESVDENTFYPAKVSIIQEYKSERDLLRFERTSAKGNGPWRFSRLLDFNLPVLTVGEETNLCMILDLSCDKYKFSQNGTILMEMEAKRYLDITYFEMKSDIAVSEIDISYF